MIEPLHDYRIEPVEPISIVSTTKVDINGQVLGSFVDEKGALAVALKLNELIAAHNELLAKYESHKHQYECEEGRRQTQAPRKDGS